MRYNLGNPFPSNGTTGTEYDDTTHTAKFEKGNLDTTFFDCVANLGAPTGITICCKMVMLISSGEVHPRKLQYRMNEGRSYRYGEGPSP